MPSSRFPRTRPYRVAASADLLVPYASAGNGMAIPATTDSDPPIIALRVILEPTIGPPPVDSAHGERRERSLKRFNTWVSELLPELFDERFPTTPR